MSAAAATPAIRLKGVSKSFGEKKVLIGLDLEVKKGESLVLVGQSGIGKSVLLKHVIGLLKPDSGTVEIDGVDLWAAPSRERDTLRRKFGMSFQEGALFDSMSVGENIAFPLTRHTKKSKKEIAERVAECLELVRLPGIEEKRPSELSGGMKRRVGFARAIALQPENLLFDEPTTGLDPITTDVVVKVIEEMRTRLKPSAITITHDLKVAFAIADRVGLLFGRQDLRRHDPEGIRAIEGQARRGLRDRQQRARAPGGRARAAHRKGARGKGRRGARMMGAP